MEVVGQLRQAVRAQAAGFVESTRCTFNALNLAQNAFSSLTNQMRAPEEDRFERLVLEGVSASNRKWLASEPAVGQLAQLTPLIMDMRMVRDRLRSYPAGVARDQIPKELLNSATGQHRALSSAYALWQAGQASDEDVLKQLARLLYLVRSNIAHGDKSDDPSDLRRWLRDRDVCGVALPAAAAVVEGLLNFPSQRLIADEGLRRGDQSPLRILDGEWSRAYLNGSMDASGLHWQTHAPSIPVSVFSSSELKKWWAPLDEFYGASARRLPAPVRSTTGTAVVAQVYEPQP
jgi:hypothetical protein